MVFISRAAEVKGLLFLLLPTDRPFFVQQKGQQEPIEQRRPEREKVSYFKTRKTMNYLINMWKSWLFANGSGNVWCI